MSTTRPGYTNESMKTKTNPAATLFTLHSNLEVIFTKFDRGNRGSIVAQDLFPILDFFECEQGVTLLDSEPKSLLRKFCIKNAELELSPEDLYRLISQLSAPPHSPDTITHPKPSITAKRASTTPRPHSTLGFTHPLSPLASRQRTTPVARPLSTRNAAAEVDRRREIYLDELEDQDTYLVYSVEQDTTKPYNSPYFNEQAHPRFTSEPLSYNRSSVESCDISIFDRPNFLEKSLEDFSMNSKEAAFQIGNLSRVSLELNRRLRQTEKNLTLSVRQHEERIAELQIRVDDMKIELSAKRREIQEYKSNERAHLQQICMLEAEIVSISRILSHHKNMYSELRHQYDEKREETEKLQLQLEIREEELLKGEMGLENYVLEQKKYQQERSAFEMHISKLEQEISFAQTLEHEVDELREENHYLRDVVDRLRQDLDDAIKGVNIKAGNKIVKGTEDVDIENEKNLLLELSSILEDCPGVYSCAQGHDKPNLSNAEITSFGSREQEPGYLMYLENQNQFFKAEAKDASLKWEKAVHQLQEAKKAITFERHMLQEEINRLREKVNSHAMKETGVQCDFIDEHQTSIENEDSSKNSAFVDSFGNCSESVNVDRTQIEEFHQNLEMEYRKLIIDFKAQECLIQELLVESDNRKQIPQAPATLTGILQRVSAPRHNLVRRRCEAVSNSRADQELSSLRTPGTAIVSKTRGSGTVAVILYTLVVYILGIVTTMFLQQPIIDHKSQVVSDTNSTAMTWYPEHQPRQEEQLQPRTRPLDYLIYWFQALAQGDELIQVPT